MAGDALVTFTSYFVMGMARRIINFFRMTGHAGIVCLFFSLKSVPTAACVTSDTMELARLEAWTDQPRGASIIFSEVTAIGVKVRVLKGDEVIMIEEFFTRRESGCQGNHLSVAGPTRSIALVWSK